MIYALLSVEQVVAVRDYVLESNELQGRPAGSS